MNRWLRCVSHDPRFAERVAEQGGHVRRQVPTSCSAGGTQFDLRHPFLAILP